MSGSALAVVRPLVESDLPAADKVFRTAFGTFLGLPEPHRFGGDADYIGTRWRANPSAAFGAESGGTLVGSSFSARWGSVGFFGPLTVRPDLWDSGIGKRLLEPAVACFDRWGTRYAGLFTFPHSAKHLNLYQRFGFWPRFLTALMSHQVPEGERFEHRLRWTRLSEVPAGERESVIGQARALTDAVYEGLDVSSEIRAVADQRLGDTVLAWRDGALNAVAVCHAGPGSEAGSGTCYIKFGAVRPGPHAAAGFDDLLIACERFAAAVGAKRLAAGVNTARQEAYAQMLGRGFRTDMQGVAMHRPNDPGYSRPGVYLIDDWR